ncbi:MAG: thiamine diphosphokinase [Chitinophagaceae bacterium]
MSSHHVVREAQEPALIIANGESCRTELIGQLLEWSPFIVVLDGALERVLQLGIKFDVVLGDFDHQSLDEVRSKIPPDTLIEFVPDQEKTDLEKGIEYLIQRNFKAVNIIWATGKRSDHYINNIGILARYSDKINQVMIDDHSRIYPISSGFKKYYSENENISLIPLNRVSNIVTENLVWNLDGKDLEYPFNTSSSNKVASSGIVSVCFDSGFLLMMECLD